MPTSFANLDSVRVESHGDLVKTVGHVQVRGLAGPFTSTTSGLFAYMPVVKAHGGCYRTERFDR